MYKTGSSAKDCNLYCLDGIMFRSLFPQRLSGTIMRTPEALNQFWIPELEDIHHYLTGINASALVGMGFVLAFTTYWLTCRQKATKPRVDHNQQSVELPVGGLSILPCCLIIQTPTHSTACVSGDPWFGLVFGGMFRRPCSVRSFNKHTKLVIFSHQFFFLWCETTLELLETKS